MRRRSLRRYQQYCGYHWVALLSAILAVPGCSIISGSLRQGSVVRANSATAETIRVAQKNDGAEIAKIDSRGPTTKTSRAGEAPSTRLMGVASWYGPGFTGEKTASGEFFDDTKFTAAHRSLPLGSKVRVINLKNGKSVEVVIKDRGPYVPGRIIDLSRVAARALGMIDNGIAKVRLELVQDVVVAERVPIS